MIQIRLTVIKDRLHMVDVISAAGESVDTLSLKTKQLHGLEALVDDEGDRGAISSVQVIQ